MRRQVKLTTHGILLRFRGVDARSIVGESICISRRIYTRPVVYGRSSIPTQPEAAVALTAALGLGDLTPPHIHPWKTRLLRFIRRQSQVRVGQFVACKSGRRWIRQRCACREDKESRNKRGGGTSGGCYCSTHQYKANTPTHPSPNSKAQTRRAWQLRDVDTGIVPRAQTKEGFLAGGKRPQRFDKWNLDKCWRDLWHLTMLVLPDWSLFCAGHCFSIVDSPERRHYRIAVLDQCWLDDSTCSDSTGALLPLLRPSRTPRPARKRSARPTCGSDLSRSRRAA